MTPRPCTSGVGWIAIVAAVFVGSSGLGACAHAPPPSAGDFALQSAPVAGDSTLALWHFDETTGLEFSDAGPAHRDGTLDIDTRTTFGRFRNARLFTPSINSFALVPAERAPELGAAWTIEAWVKPSQYGPVECNVIAARWTDQPNEQGWMLGLVGYNRVVVSDTQPRSNLFDVLTPARIPGV